MKKMNKIPKKAVLMGKRLLLLLLILAVLPFQGTQSVSADEDDIREAEANLQAAKDKEAQLEQQLAALSSNITSTQDTVYQMDALSSALSVEIYNLEQNIIAKQAEIDNKQIEIDNTNATIATVRTNIADTQINLENAQNTEASQYESMKLRIQFMYENGDESFMDLLFSSDSMEDFLSNAEYIAEISEYDRQKLVEYGITKDTIAALLVNLEEQEAELVIQEQNLETEMQSLTEQQSVLVSMKNEQEVQKASYDSIINAKNAELANLEEQKEYTAEQKALAEQEVADQQVLVEQTKREWAEYLAKMAALNQDVDAAVRAKLAEIGITGFTWPLPGYNTITSEFGNRLHPILGYYKLHDGMDISGYSVNGKPIVAAYGGTVILSEYYFGYGNCVKIDHGGGIQTLYAHASALLVSVGQTVNAGDTIALVGSTGNSTGPHLHFSLIIAGEFVNPRDYLKIP